MKKSLVYLTLTLLIASTLPLSVSADANDDIPTNAAAPVGHDSLVAAVAHGDLVGDPRSHVATVPTGQSYTGAEREGPYLAQKP